MKRVNMIRMESGNCCSLTEWLCFIVLPSDPTKSPSIAIAYHDPPDLPAPTPSCESSLTIETSKHIDFLHIFMVKFPS
ncbi:hypothetical protein BD289DRAFT_81716 [Coniella lustricola]|uniref:Uncharacterized protein n=1 Tax=Coniella lustricola TaxID=2025994 RepID=A0A2T3AH74_9PEZI|nr:hypothetical protein BD289DRAFT_81716 [Coniella lustricola]